MFRGITQEAAGALIFTTYCAAAASTDAFPIHKYNLLHLRIPIDAGHKLALSLACGKTSRSGGNEFENLRTSQSGAAAADDVRDMGQPGCNCDRIRRVLSPASCSHNLHHTPVW